MGFQAPRDVSMASTYPRSTLSRGGDEWEAFPWQHPSELFSSLWRGGVVGAAAWGPPPHDQGVGVAVASGPAPLPAPGSLFPSSNEGFRLRLPRATPEA